MHACHPSVHARVTVTRVSFHGLSLDRDSFPGKLNPSVSLSNFVQMDARCSSMHDVADHYKLGWDDGFHLAVNQSDWSILQSSNLIGQSWASSYQHKRQTKSTITSQYSNKLPQATDPSSSVQKLQQDPQFPAKITENSLNNVDKFDNLWTFFKRQ